jgi:hypothetical protein
MGVRRRGWLVRFWVLIGVGAAVVGGYHLWTKQSLAIAPAPAQVNARVQVETVAQGGAFVWWEAESPAADNFPPAKVGPFAASNPQEAELLSGGQWISADGKYGEPLYLNYAVEVPTAANYFFYTRKFWRHGPFRWRWDGGPWQIAGSSAYLLDTVELRSTISADWVSLGRVDLGVGRHELRIELTQAEGPVAFDCFALTAQSWQPRGLLQPNQRRRISLPDWFAFDPAVDPFRPSGIDLRRLNEAIAGENGFIQVKGESFIQPKTGKPMRFWAVNSGPQVLQMDAPSLEYMARFLAKHGVNMVRLHGRLFEEDDFRKISPDTVTRLFAFVAAMKQQGIYTNLSIYFPLFLKLDAAQGFAGYDGKNPFALLFFNPKFEQIYQGWWRSLLGTVNPATGQTLAADPAVAMVELVNEDSYFFWTFDPYRGVPAPQMELLEKQFGTWLVKKYGNLDAALKRWQQDAKSPKPIQADRPQDGRVAFVAIADLFNQRDAGRSQDTAAFLADSQLQFFNRNQQFLRQQLNYRGLTYASNWITANAQILGPLDKYTNTVADFMDRHGYMDSFHEGPTATYAVRPTDRYRDRSALRFDGREGGQDFSLPIMDLRYNGKPSTISEVNWPQPNRFRADLPLLASAYGSLQGTDGFCLFATSQHGWESAAGKFAIATPAIMGQFPAAAVLYRQGLLTEGKDVVTVDLPIEDVYKLRGAPVSAPQNLDALRQQDVRSPSTAQTTLDPLAFLVGKVNLNFSQPGAQSGPKSGPKSGPQSGTTSQQVNLSEFIDRPGQTIRSSTDQLRWNYRQGLVTVNAPAAQGVTGFLKTAGPQTLQDIRIETEMDYGTVLVVALDGQPIGRSRQLLLQVMSEEQNLGWRTSGGSPQTIESVGNPPVVVRNLQGKVMLQRADAGAMKVTALDWNGYPTKQWTGAATVDLAETTLYYLIER